MSTLLEKNSARKDSSGGRLPFQTWEWSRIAFGTGVAGGADDDAGIVASGLLLRLALSSLSIIRRYLRASLCNRSCSISATRLLTEGVDGADVSSSRVFFSGGSEVEEAAA